MALSTCHRRPHPHGQSGVNTINHGNVTKFFIVGAAFVIGQRVAMKGGGYQLFVGRLRQKIAGHLFDRELVKRHVVINGLNHPVAVGPDCARRVVGVACRISITGQVQPLASPVFTVFGSSQQAVDNCFEGIFRLVCNKGLHFFQRRRKANHVQINTANQRFTIGFGGRLKVIIQHPAQDKVVHRVFDPRLIIGGSVGDGRLLRLHIGPVPRVRSSLSNPLF